MEANDFKIRASAAGQINGVRGLGKTGETYTKKWALSKMFGRTIEIKNKYLERGNFSEDESIVFASKMLNIELVKNEKHYEDEYFTGTPDLVTPDLIIDMKNSWSWETFPFFDTDINKDYFSQLQVYMHLAGRKKAKLVYALLDTPEHLIEREAWQHCRALGLEELDGDIYEEFEKKMTYKDIPDKNKLKVFDIDYDKNLIDKLIKRVVECREYLEKIIICKTL